MKKLRVLIVDDSVFFRSQIRAALESVNGVEVVGVASNGKIALSKLAQSPADVVTLDLEMPEMDGLSTLVEMRRLGIKSQVIVFSSHTKRGTEAALEALAKGAYDFLAKPAEFQLNPGETPTDAIRNQLVPKITQFMHSEPLEPMIAEAPTPLKTYPAVRSWETYQPQVITIASSTGGPGALEKIFSILRGPLRCPILIAQHMPPVFTATLAQRLAQLSGLEVAEAKHQEPLHPNRVYLAPGDYHLCLEQSGRTVRTVLNQEPLRNSVRPAADFLFESAAKLFGVDCLGFVLTGMGEDGMVGAIAVKDAGGRIVIQEQSSCVVFGMPGAVKRAGAYDRTGDPSEIAHLINRLNLSQEVAS